MFLPLDFVVLLIEHVHIHLYETGIAIYFCEVFQYYAFPECHNIYMNKYFQGHYYFQG